MSIKMVREPSETPNINNIDDIVPMRYAYGGQNGYVIGKGNEISNTVNGLNFTVNSGRLVLQGVECDIDAVGVAVTIDNIATTRYYVVYLQVNLGTNTASILSTYDTATYPTIDAGDDLTENTTGVARLPLYRFIATNGVISEVNKVVESIKYVNEDFISNVKVNDAYKVNNLEIKQDENGILKIGDIIIPQKKLIWQGESTEGNINISQLGVATGDIIEIEYTLTNNSSQMSQISSSNNLLKIRLSDPNGNRYIGDMLTSSFYAFASSSTSPNVYKFVEYDLNPYVTTNTSGDWLLNINSRSNARRDIRFEDGMISSAEFSSTLYRWKLLKIWKVIE